MGASVLRMTFQAILSRSRRQFERSVDRAISILDLWNERRVKPHDHPNFAVDKIIIRRARRDLHVGYDNNRGYDRLTSALFKYEHPSGYLSCDSHFCIIRRGRNPVQYVRQGGWDGAVQLTVRDFRSVQRGSEVFKIGMAPLIGNRCHGAIWGRIRRGQSNDLLRLSAWLAPIPGVNIV